MVETNEDLIRRFYAARERDDRDEIRTILAPDIRWHDPYPPPHGGDLVGVDAVFAQIFDAAAEITQGTTRLRLEDVVATKGYAFAIVGWSSTIGGKTSGGREVGMFRMVDSTVVEVWFCVEDLERAVGFFG